MRRRRHYSLFSSVPPTENGSLEVGVARMVKIIEFSLNETAYFSRYFKTHVGGSPIELRKSMAIFQP